MADRGRNLDLKQQPARARSRTDLPDKRTAPPAQAGGAVEISEERT